MHLSERLVLLAKTESDELTLPVVGASENEYGDPEPLMLHEGVLCYMNSDLGRLSEGSHPAPGLDLLLESPYVTRYCLAGTEEEAWPALREDFRRYTEEAEAQQDGEEKE